MTKTTLLPLEHLMFETAAEHVCSRVPIAAPDSRAGDVRRSMAGQRYDSATHIAVCDGSRLVGLLRIEDLLAAPEDAAMRQLMDAEPPIVAPGTDQEIAAWHALQHEETALPVVDGQGRFVGFVPPQRLLAVLLREHEEDMARLGGYLHDTSAARSASLEAVKRRFWHRIPWLLLGLLGALLAADIVGAFEKQLAETVTLAFFIPGIVYLADAVGTQTETLVVRGLSVGVGIGQILRREAFTGILIGIALSLAFFPLALWRWGDSRVALAVSLALLTACSTATFVALSLPWLFQRLGRDPAYGTGPLATVIQDLLSILIYFAIATAVVF
jgi:magnesium transporter